MIYFVECIGADAIKIGYCRPDAKGLVHRRVSIMQSNCPLPLKLLAVMGGGADRERELHGLFSDDWIRGEWFKATDALRAFVARLPSAPPPPRQGDPRYNRRPAKLEVAA